MTPEKEGNGGDGYINYIDRQHVVKQNKKNNDFVFMTTPSGNDTGRELLLFSWDGQHQICRDMKDSERLMCFNPLCVQIAHLMNTNRELHRMMQNMGFTGNLHTMNPKVKRFIL